MNENEDLLLAILNSGYHEGEYNDGQIHKAWEAIEICNDHKIALPEWVILYLGEVAHDLLSIDKPGKDFPMKVVEALRVEASDFTANKKGKRDDNLYAYILFHEAPKMVDRWEAGASKFGLSESAVKNLFYKKHKEREEIHKHFIEQFKDESFMQQLRKEYEEWELKNKLVK